MPAHLWRELDLTKIEIEAIETWLADIAVQALPSDKYEHYVLVPPARREYDATTPATAALAL